MFFIPVNFLMHIFLHLSTWSHKLTIEEHTLKQRHLVNNVEWA